ncbi:MAG: Ig-like domain-containing protein [Saprospiraceae bacterium]|nr:Ig-like domain-containing protein [Saprospiraceae bacterium]
MNLKMQLKCAILFVFMSVILCHTAGSQSIKPFDLVGKAKASTSSFEPIKPFVVGTRNGKDLPSELKEYSILKIDKSASKGMLRNAASNFLITLPVTSTKSLQLELVEVKLPAFSVVEAPAMTRAKFQDGKHYRGIVKGQSKSLVAISVFNEEIMGFVSEERSKGNWVLGKLKDNTGDHIIYKDADLMGKFGFECGTPDSGTPYDKSELNHSDAARSLADCVGMYFEVDYNIFQDKGSLANTTSYVTGLFNQVATLYANEQINTNISEIVVWSTTSPYTGTTSSVMLDQFTAYRNGFNGNIAMLLSYAASGGIAYVNTLCNTVSDYRMGFSSIYNSYATVPTYSWSVEVVTHEFGHLLGSQHTHACVWNGNNTAIDGCYTTEGGCASPGLPAAGGTVMSYCHLTSAGINFNNGFGPQPGAIIRTAVTNATCLPSCSTTPPTCTDGLQNGQETGVDCGGPTCPPCSNSCTTNPGSVVIVVDDFPGETTWDLKNSIGAIIYSGGPYASGNPSNESLICLSAGCYTFTIYDAYGDGICCAYGNGSYNVTVNGINVATGGTFGSSSIHNFCVNNTAPSCTDGIQNQGETGIDCGGPNCAACNSCNDGIQNGNETGIDCGGSCGFPIVSISGSTSICAGTTTTLNPTTGGTWVSSNTAVATVTNAGLVTGVSAGTATFTFTNTAGCASLPTGSVSINARPVVTIASTAICIGATTTLTPTTGGTWVSSNTAVATVTNAGLVTGVSAGTATFTFTSTSTGCSSLPTGLATVSSKASSINYGQCIDLCRCDNNFKSLYRWNMVKQQYRSGHSQQCRFGDRRISRYSNVYIYKCNRMRVTSDGYNNNKY